LACEVVQLVLRELKRLRLVPEHGIGGALDPTAELIEVLGDASLLLARLVHKTTAEQLGSRLQPVVNISLSLVLRLLTEQVIKLAVEGGFCGLARVRDFL
jgi:hypothetical protein